METMVVVAERLVHGGRCLATAPDGRRLLVAGAVPGERVRVRVQPTRGVWMGAVEEVLEASHDRVEEALHPGLDLSHVRYERQLELKRGVVDDAFGRAVPSSVAPLELEGVVPSPRIWGYRGTIQPATLQPQGETPSRLGYRVPGSHRVVALEHDPTANEACARGWVAATAVRLPGGVREVVFRGNDAGEVLVALVATTPTRDLLDVAHELVRSGVHGVVGAPYDPRGRFRGGAQRLAGARSIRQRYGDVTLTLSATAFAQPNPSAAHELYRALAEWAPPGRHALDLYAGNGVIGMHLHEKAELVTVVDIDRGSIDRGRRDAEEAGRTNLVHRRADARELTLPAGLDLIAVDPPRAGLAGMVREAIDATTASTLIYVSCDPATWARDVADFLGRGWTLARARAFDFQPHTHHVELLSMLHREVGRR